MSMYVGGRKHRHAGPDRHINEHKLTSLREQNDKRICFFLQILQGKSRANYSDWDKS